MTWPSVSAASSASSAEECVGFADCPCRGCRTTRVAVTKQHPEHHLGEIAYCGACRTKDRAKHYRNPAVP